MLPVLDPGWEWNGFYTRQLNSPFLHFFGKVAIRVAYDKKNKVHHAFIPAFIVPGLKLTVFDLQVLITSFMESFSTSLTLENYSKELPEYYDLPLSSFYHLLAWFCRRCRSVLNLPIEGNSINHLRPYLNGLILGRFLKDINTRAPPS